MYFRKELIEFKDELSKMDGVYKNLSDNQKPVFSYYYTNLLFDILDDYEIDYSKFSFINYDLMYDYKNNKKRLLNKEIGMIFGQSEASFSRTIRGFKDKLFDVLHE